MKLLLLTVLNPDGTRWTRHLTPGAFMVGSSKEAAIQIPDPTLSERHLQLDLDEHGLDLEPLGPNVEVHGVPQSGKTRHGYPALIGVGGLHLKLEAVSQESVAETVAIPLPEQTMVLNWGEHGGEFLQPRAVLQGGYDLLQEIARGGMGRIYLGSDPALKRQVAVKVSSVSRHGADLRFEREAEVLAQLAHPNIVPIHSMGVDSEGRPFYAMKLVKGRTLQEILVGLRKREPGLEREYPLFALLDLFRKVCDAMAFAHSRRILHRDLKPDNIMVGEYGEVLVMDWGLAKHLEGMDPGQLGAGRAGSGQFPEQTMEGEVMGTPLYMSPEQAAGRVSELDERSDIYALGAILYAILTLEPPIEGRTTEEVLSRVRIGQIRPMRGNPGFSRRIRVLQSKGLGRGIPEALKAVTLKAMALEPGSRYRSVSELTSELEAYRNGFATEAEAAGALKRMRLWMGRNRILAGSVSVLLTVVSVFSIRVVSEGRKASLALQELRASAPVFASRAQDALEGGDFDEAEKLARNAVRLRGDTAEYHLLLGNALQVAEKWGEAVAEYSRASDLGSVRGSYWAGLTLQLLQKTDKDTARDELISILRENGRPMEAVGYSRRLGQEFWQRRGEKLKNLAENAAEAERLKRQDLSVVADLVQHLEVKLLPIPGTQVLMSKTEFTVAEWKLYLKAEGFLPWVQPAANFAQTDDHPVVKVSWEEATNCCRWLSQVTGDEWRLPTNAEWDAAAGATKYPWGDYYPPHWDDGNYRVLESGQADPEYIGLDGIKGTAPVGSFKPNALGFYDLGGNALEWVCDGPITEENMHFLRGGSWFCFPMYLKSSELSLLKRGDGAHFYDRGFRVVRKVR